ncbi:putative angiotensin-converting enzyme 2 [Dioscorea sansibarensis]
MSGGEVRRVSHQDIQLVQNLIERCLQLYMNQKEVVDTLLMQAKIEPGFTELVWQKLEEENGEFFKAYHVRLVLKDQIQLFNKLLDKQVELMRKICPSGVGSVSPSNGTNSSTLHQTPYFVNEQASASGPANLLCSGDPTSAMLNGGTAGNQPMQVNNDGPFCAATDISTSMLSTQNSNMGMLQGMNGTTIKSEPCYSNGAEFAFCADNSFLNARSGIEDASVASFGSSDLTGPALNEPLLDVDPSIGFLSQIPRSFSFSDLTEDFTQCNDILENYGRSPFLASEANNFSDSPLGDCKDETRRLGTISEGLSHEDFGSD